MCARTESVSRSRASVARSVLPHRVAGSTSSLSPQFSATTSRCSLADTAAAVEPRRILGEHPAGGRGGLYTALTRSTRALAVVHTEPLPDELDAAPDLVAVPEAGAAAAWAAGLQPLQP